MAEAVQAAAIAVLKEAAKVSYGQSFYYWAGYTPHGFADVKLDNAVLGQIHSCVMKQRQGSDHVIYIKNEMIAAAAATVPTGQAHYLTKDWEQDIFNKEYQGYARLS